MTPALQEITIYRPDYAMVMGKGMTRVPYVNPESSSGDFQVTDSCERSAAVMGDDYVKLSFELLHQQVFEAFSFIWYDNQLFFLKETYRPTSKGAYFKYDMKFVSIANMLDKQVCFRYITVSGQSIQPEPEINMNGTLDDMASIVVDSIHGAASRLAGTSRPQLYYAYVLQRLTLADDTLQGTTLQTFSFSGQKIAETLTEIANAYETEWWISQEDIQTVKLHMCKCECGDAIIVSDEYKVNGNEYESRGLLSCEYTQEWGNIPQKIIAFGSDRNLTRNQALQDVNGNQMYVSYGKQLRLAPNTSYTVKDREGNPVVVRTDGIGALTNTGVTSGIESVVVRDDIYPRCHFRVLGVTVKGTDNPIFTITAGALKADGVTVMSYAEMVAEQLLPLQIAPNETLSISFESGYLNGKEFEVAYDYKEVNGVMEWALTIVPEQGDDNGVSLPFGNLAPKVGDQFAIFHMIMPQFYITRAQEELAQVAYDEMLGVQDTRPEIKCKSEPEFFANQRVILGQRMGVHSELFGNILLDTNGDIAEGSPSLFVSRVTQFTHSLTTPNDVELRLASSRVEGHLSEIEAAIADQTDDIRGLEQRTINLSRRGWHDAAEMRDMLNSLAAEFLLIGEQKNQFAFTSAIECVNGYVVADIDHFDHLHVSAGYIQHTQEPYIKYGNSGRWDINVTDITTDENSNSLDPTKAYYLYAICAAGATTATIVLTDDTTKASNTDYLLMGILSSEYENENTKKSYRVFNRSNGFTRVAGGTITTEQIQDPTRSLIIDFSSNPPRIIARNGAKIIGNIEFELTEEQIAEIIGSVGSDYEYLKEALQQSTRITGGLVSTSVIELQDGGTTTAGISGLNSDGILLWGGATYSEACNAATEGNDYYTQPGKGDRQITTLIRKDGTGKIGIFKISKTQAVVDVQGQGSVLIDASSRGGIYVRNSNGENKISIKNGEIGNDFIPEEYTETGKKSFSFSNVLCSGSSGTCSTQRSADLWEDMVETYSNGTNTVTVKFVNMSFRQMLRYFGSTPTANTTAKVILYAKTGGGGYSAVATKTLTLENVTSGSNYVSELTYQNFTLTHTSSNAYTYILSVEVNGKDHYACLGDFMMQGDVEWSWHYVESSTPQTIIGTDGIATIYNNNAYFMVKNTSTGQKVYAKGLSTNKGVTAGNGELYISNANNDGMVKTLKAALNAISTALQNARYIGDNSSYQSDAKTAIDNAITALNKISIVAST